ncbi:hypothetical protein [Phycicoccus sp. HDW14]|uniref:hypothetical protein n=1 Tax=Phycicoccus sp. HDW14 TaxID=2714941 RepID=UPI001F10AACE|nr:hypothetical protein [Phycicoccus sp. HDW14]
MAGEPGETDGGVLLVLEEQLRRERERIEARRRDLEEAEDLLTRATSRSLGARETPVEELGDGLTTSVVTQLLADSAGMVRSFVLTVEQGPALDGSTVRANRTRMERGDSQRAIYPAEVLTTVRGQHWLDVWAEAGEDQRVLPHTATEFAVFGDTAVVALGGGTTSTAGTCCSGTHSSSGCTRRTSTSPGGTRCRYPVHATRATPGTPTRASSTCWSWGSRTRPSPGTSVSACARCVDGWPG